MHDLIRHDQMVTANGDMAEQRFLDIDLTRAKNKAQQWLTSIVQKTNIGNALQGLISADEVYIVNIPEEIRKAVAEGENWFTKKKDTGELLCQVSHEVDGKKQILKNLTMEPSHLVSPESLVHMTDGMYNFAMQQQMAMIAEELKAVHESVKRIEEGQIDDRVGAVRGAIMQLRDASRYQDQDKRNVALANAVQSLNNALGPIEESLERRIKAFKMVPSNPLVRRIGVWVFDDSYIDGRTRDFNNIKLYIDCYVQAYVALAMAHHMLGETQLARIKFKEMIEYLATIDYKKIQTIQYLYPGIDFSEEWFSNPHLYVKGIEARFREFAEKGFDQISARVTGQQLLEAIRNAKSGQEAE